MGYGPRQEFPVHGTLETPVPRGVLQCIQSWQLHGRLRLAYELPKAKFDEQLWRHSAGGGPAHRAIGTEALLLTLKRKSKRPGCLFEKGASIFVVSPPNYSTSL